uniref:7TM_GPCR_Srx domain-containing protein n=1 Tax=Caenorhabditis tropicalis TaxID=1561998 RepID=A0A1I7UTY4_9PELO
MAQTAIPVSLLWGFVIAMIIDAITFIVTQELVNLAVVICSLHGIVESVAVLSVHQSYRRAVWRMVTRENHDKVSDVHVAPPAVKRSKI